YTAWVDAGLILPTDVEMPGNTRPAEFGLDQNFPNPFNPTTTISYHLPVGGTVALRVYSLDGREVAAPVLANQSAGYHSVKFTASSLGSGVYLYRLQLGSFSQTKKFVLLK
ncbi:MAG: Por secretion system C-terminal sorting protein, partial [Bacteroidetes bacterium]|nr:Por secretion system C-terminal sorting protein [Bacteroidota bacterium]